MKWFCPDCHREWKDKAGPPAWHFGYLREQDGSLRIGQSSRYRCSGVPVEATRDDSK